MRAIYPTGGYAYGPRTSLIEEGARVATHNQTQAVRLSQVHEMLITF